MSRGGSLLAIGVLTCVGCGPSGCVQPASEATEAQDPDPPVPGPPACRTSTAADPLARFAGGRCGWELVDSGTSVVLSSLDAEPDPAATGAAPEVCSERPCSYEGHATTAGPIILARVEGASSEMPDGVWLGFSQGAQLGFVDLWEGGGPDVVGDDTELGPTHGLAPYACGDELALLVQPRTNAGMGVDPAPQLAARAGVYAVQGGGLQRVGDAPGEGCVALRVPLP